MAGQPYRLRFSGSYRRTVAPASRLKSNTENARLSNSMSINRNSPNNLWGHQMIRRKHAEFMKLFEAQGVSSYRHYAVVCPICGTVQSMASLVKSGAEKDVAPAFFGFSCEGRFNGAGPARKSKDQGKRGCDWTLGGLFQLHTAEIEQEDGTIEPVFDVATPEQAQALEAEVTIARDDEWNA